MKMNKNCLEISVFPSLWRQMSPHGHTAIVYLLLQWCSNSLPSLHLQVKVILPSSVTNVCLDINLYPPMACHHNRIKCKCYVQSLARSGPLSLSDHLPSSPSTCMLHTPPHTFHCSCLLTQTCLHSLLVYCLLKALPAYAPWWPDISSS